MRRKERQIRDIADIEAVIAKATVCRLALFDKPAPYILPLCFGYRDQRFYFHTGLLGKKMALIRADNRAGFELDLSGTLVTGPRPCDWTLKYQSVVGYGRVFLIEDPAEKQTGLDAIMGQYGGRGPFEYGVLRLAKTAILKLIPETMSGRGSA